MRVRQSAERDRQTDRQTAVSGKGEEEAGAREDEERPSPWPCRYRVTHESNPDALTSRTKTPRDEP